MKTLLTLAFLSVLTIGAANARPMMYGAMEGEPAQNFYYYFGKGCQVSTCNTCNTCDFRTFGGLFD